MVISLGLLLAILMILAKVLSEYRAPGKAPEAVHKVPHSSAPVPAMNPPTPASSAMKQKESDRLEAEFQKRVHEARRAEQRHNFSEAEQLVREALKLKPDDISIKAQLGELIRRKDDAMVAAKNTEFQTLLKQAGDFLAQHKKQEAHECYKRALAIKPNDPQALEGLKQSEISVEK